jgi:hypothetical protein
LAKFVAFSDYVVFNFINRLLEEPYDEEESIEECFEQIEQDTTDEERKAIYEQLPESKKELV